MVGDIECGTACQFKIGREIGNPNYLQGVIEGAAPGQYA